MDCQKCAFYKPGSYPQTGMCTKYIAYRGRGKVVYEFAASVRASERKCGAKARFFIARHNEKNTSSDRYRLLQSLFEDDE